jgi:thiol-disulfide isomerase/thioredoxin
MAKARSRKSSAAQGQEQRQPQASNQQPSRGSVSSARQQRLEGRQRNQRKRIKSNRSPWIIVGGVLVIVAVIIGIFLYLSHQSSSVTTGTTPASTTVLQAVTHVDPKVLAAVGAGGVQNTPKALHGQPPLMGPTGRPEFFYYGAEWCPYCAAQRWAMVVALSRFGTFGHLDQTTSSSSDVYPNTPTLTFYHGSYSSSYIDFVPVEFESNQQDSSGNYTALQTPTAEQQKLVDTYDSPPYVSSDAQGGIPFIDIANQYIVPGPGYSPQVLSGLKWQDIANDLSNPASPVTQGIVGTANYLTAAICITTNQQPASVCTAAPIPQIEQSLGKSTAGASGTQVGFMTTQPQAIVRRTGMEVQGT